MKNNIYDELNDMKIEYEEVPLNDFERENLKRTVRSLKIKNKKNILVVSGLGRGTAHTLAYQIKEITHPVAMS